MCTERLPWHCRKIGHARPGDAQSAPTIDCRRNGNQKSESKHRTQSRHTDADMRNLNSSDLKDAKYAKNTNPGGTQKQPKQNATRCATRNQSMASYRNLRGREKCHWRVLQPPPLCRHPAGTNHRRWGGKSSGRRTARDATERRREHTTGRNWHSLN